MQSQELVSIILPTFNRAALIGATLESILAQTHQHWELLIMDDGSSDGTDHVVNQYTDSRISFHALPHSGVLGKVRNEGMKRSHGDLIAFLDSDDLWIPQKLETQLHMLNQNPQATFIFSNHDEFGAGATLPPDAAPFVVGNFFKDILLLHKFSICMPSLVFQKKALHQIGYIQEKYISGGDIDFFFRLCHEYTGIYSNQRLVSIRKHEGNSSNRFGEVVFTEQIQMIHEFFDMKWLTKEEFLSLKSFYYYRMGLSLLEDNRSSDAATAFGHYVKLRPLHWKGWARFIQATFPL